MKLLFVLIVCLSCWGSACWALDNPDAEDHRGNFLARAQVYEQAVQSFDTTQEGSIVYGEYAEFLDRALNDAYRALMKVLGKKQQKALQRSQRIWLKYRDAELNFVIENWNRENFGTSSVLSAGDYRTTLLRNRVLLLLAYLQNY